MTLNSGTQPLDQLNNCNKLGSNRAFLVYDMTISKKPILKLDTLHARLELIEYIVDQENQNSNGDFEEDNLRETLALMDAPKLIELAHILKCNHF